MKKIVFLMMVVGLVGMVGCDRDEDNIDNLSNDDFVDLELPSGVLWANHNVGATVLEGYGNYYNWDAALEYASGLGSGQRMPTVSEWNELKANTTQMLITVNGVLGAKFTGANGNSIFLPAAGWRNNDGSMHCLAGYGCYWAIHYDFRAAGSYDGYMPTHDSIYRLPSCYYFRLQDAYFSQSAGHATDSISSGCSLRLVKDRFQ